MLLQSPWLPLGSPERLLPCRASAKLLTSQLMRGNLKPAAIDVIASARTGDDTVYESVARHAGMSLKRFCVPVDQVGFRPADHIVNVPIDTMMKDAGMGRIKTYREIGTFDHW
jgi:hypothetical protein